MEWKRSSACKADQPMCVEFRRYPDGAVELRDADGDVVAYSADEWAAFLVGAKAGEFD